MTIYPAAIIVVNNDLTDNVENVLIRQLGIDKVLDGYSFDMNVANDGYYSATVKNSNLRILVIRSLDESFNRDMADVVAFVKAGLIAIENNKFGPHGITFPVVNLTWKKLGVLQL